MMRSRGDANEIRASTYQYHPRFLLYKARTPWHLGTLPTVVRRIEEALPADLRPAFQHLVLGRARQHERDTLRVARWIETHGATHGFRTPNPRERARATGRGPYLTSLGLSDKQLYDAVGNHFDADALIVRLAGPISDWCQGHSSGTHTFLPPSQLYRAYMRLRREVIQANCAACTHPFPEDLRALLLVPPPHFLAPVPAAEYGRDVR